MAKIRDPLLTIEPVATQAHQWRVTVSYKILFPRWEVGCWYGETVELRGGTPETDSGEAPLLRLQNEPWKLDPGDQQPDDDDWYRIARSTTPQVVGPQILDENTDGHVLVLETQQVKLQTPAGQVTTSPVVTGRRERAILREDSIYARVELNPRIPQACSAKSNVVRGQFGEES